MNNFFFFLSYRVDSIHNEAYKIMGGLVRGADDGNFKKNYYFCFDLEN